MRKVHESQMKNEESYKKSWEENRKFMMKNRDVKEAIKLSAKMRKGKRKNWDILRKRKVRKSHFLITFLAASVFTALETSNSGGSGNLGDSVNSGDSDDSGEFGDSVKFSDYGDAVETGYFDESGDCGKY